MRKSFELRCGTVHEAVEIVQRASGIQTAQAHSAVDQRADLACTSNLLTRDIVRPADQDVPINDEKSSVFSLMEKLMSNGINCSLSLPCSETLLVVYFDQIQRPYLLFLDRLTGIA
jgi:hypothetical protein